MKMTDSRSVAEYRHEKLLIRFFKITLIHLFTHTGQCTLILPQY